MKCHVPITHFLRSMKAPYISNVNGVEQLICYDNIVGEWTFWNSMRNIRINWKRELKFAFEI